MDKKTIRIYLIVNIILIISMACHLLWSITIISDLKKDRLETIKKEVVSFLKDYDVEIIE